jgi:hypothetical protein
MAFWDMIPCYLLDSYYVMALVTPVLGHHHSLKIFPVFLEENRQVLNVHNKGAMNAGRYIFHHFTKHE